MNETLQYKIYKGIIYILVYIAIIKRQFLNAYITKKLCKIMGTSCKFYEKV